MHPSLSKRDTVVSPAAIDGTPITAATTSISINKLYLLLFPDALAVRQVFVWGLGNGVGGAAGAKAVRIALYNR